MSTLKRLDTTLMTLIALVLVVTVGVYLYSDYVFSQSYAAEDGFVEYATAVLLFVASVVLFSNALSLRKNRRKLVFGLTLFYALLFFFAAGEEISWGQRIFGWESGEVFLENNKQDETNLHNMIIPTPWGDFHLTETIFGPFLTVVLLLYLVVLPMLYPRNVNPTGKWQKRLRSLTKLFESSWIKKICDRFAIPVPGRRHAALALAASFVIVAIDVSRKWEVYELVFSLLAVSIFLLPQNRDATK